MDQVPWEDASVMRKRPRNLWTNRRVCQTDLVLPPQVHLTPPWTRLRTWTQRCAIDTSKFWRTRNSSVRLRTSSTTWSTISRSKRSRFLRTHNTQTTPMLLTKIWKIYQSGTIIAPKALKMVPQTTKALSLPFRHPTGLTWIFSTRRRQNSSLVDSTQAGKSLARLPKQWKTPTISKSMLKPEDKVWRTKILKSTKLMLQIELKNEIRELKITLSAHNKR